MRLLLEIARLARSNVPDTMPLLCRIPGSDWVDHNPSLNAWTVEEACALGQALYKVGIDLIDVSSGGLLAQQKIKAGPGYQAPFAKRVSEVVKL
jgi:2,4-dienoyl-CoA reductase-like NADH-dependent reductase (Old Yellow Enzyme family)